MNASLRTPLDPPLPFARVQATSHAPRSHLMDAHPTAGAESPATDASALERLQRFGGGSLLHRMIDLFLAAAPARLESTRGACERGDCAAAELALHSLKASS